MLLFGDYHTHTVHSHGTGTLEENCRVAVEKGLKEIAITDHGFSHMLFRVKRKKFFDEVWKERKEVQKKFPDLKILLGVEANLMGCDGRVDVREEDWSKLDIIVCGYHKFVRTWKLGDHFGFFWPNLFGLSSSRMVAKNTNAYVKMIENYPISIVSHLNLGIKSDVKEVARAAKHFGTFIELNGKRIVLTDSEIETIASEGVKFVINSDAHSADRVGDFSVGLERIERMGLPKELIANFGQAPEFRKTSE
ncbi:MAG: PHP domain-containing protein [Firmicutes bacterium]|nr:PHP domain-containing protein [Bacillota bacterium]